MPITDDSIVLVETNSLTIYNFYPSLEDAEATIPTRLEEDEKSAKTLEAHAKDCRLSSSYWKDEAEKHRNNTYKAMTCREFDDLERSKLISDEVREITEEQYTDGLGVLPPVNWGDRDGFESFFMVEHLTSSYTSQYAKTHSKPHRYFEKLVDIFDSTTWIKLELIKM